MINSSAYHASNSIIIIFLIKKSQHGWNGWQTARAAGYEKKGLLGLFPICLHCVCVRLRHISGDLAGQTVQTLFMPTISPACILTHVMHRNTGKKKKIIFVKVVKKINKHLTIFYKIQETFDRAKITVTMLECLQVVTRVFWVLLSDPKRTAQQSL